jgi:acetylornithine/N-succinyldiaminopimelate aminotransferase
MPNYGDRDLAFERGEGPYLFATDGRRFLDFGGGIAVNVLGHCHPHLVAALKAQAEKVWHTSNLYRIPNQERAGERLAATSFADMAFFCNSGAEANEAGIKVCRKYQYDAGHPERYRIITIEGAFHGRTLANLAAGRQEKHLKGFGPMVEGFDQVPFGNLNALRGAITKETAAIMLEPVQGESGIRPIDIDYLKGVRAACDEFGLLMFLDEVQTGMGRTGKLWAHEWAGIKPDIMSTAKGLGGGFPVGVCLTTAKAGACMTAGTHGSTFGGNPLATAVVNATLDIVLAPDFLPHVNSLASYLRGKLEAIAKRYPKVIAEVRGTGLMIGFKTVPANTDMVKALTEAGMLTVTAGDNVVRLLPPLVIERSHADEACDKIEQACARLSGPQ